MTKDANRRCGDTRSSTGSGDGEASRSEAKQIWVDIAQGLSHEGCGSGPRSVFQHRRGPLSVCSHSVSADTVDIARRFGSGKPVGTYPEQRAPVWLTEQPVIFTKQPDCFRPTPAAACNFSNDRYVNNHDSVVPSGCEREAQTTLRQRALDGKYRLTRFRHRFFSDISEDQTMHRAQGDHYD